MRCLFIQIQSHWEFWGGWWKRWRVRKIYR